LEELIEYFFRKKWPDGFRCPRCMHPHAYRIDGRTLPLYQCLACRHQTSLRVGTPLEGSRTPLWKWAAAMRALGRPEGVNAIQLMKEIQVTYKTAWSMLRKLRQSIHAADELQPLSGRVEAGVAYYEARHLRCYAAHPRKYPIIVGVEYGGKDNLTYLKMKPVDPEHFTEFTLRRSGEEAFRNRHVRSDRPVPILRHIPFCKHSDMPVLFRQAVHWLHRVFHGVSRRYLGLYLGEFCFRINAPLRHRDPFETIVSYCMQVDRRTFDTRMRPAA